MRGKKKMIWQLLIFFFLPNSHNIGRKEKWRFINDIFIPFSFFFHQILHNFWNQTWKTIYFFSFPSNSFIPNKMLRKSHTYRNRNTRVMDWSREDENSFAINKQRPPIEGNTRRFAWFRCNIITILFLAMHGDEQEQKG